MDTELEINETFVKLTGKWPIFANLITPQSEEISVVIAGQRMTGSLVKIEHNNNQDGTFDRVYVIKFFS